MKYETPAAGDGENGYGHNPNSLTMAQTPGGALTVFAANEYWSYGAVQQFEWKSAKLNLNKNIATGGPWQTPKGPNPGATSLVALDTTSTVVFPKKNLANKIFGYLH